MLPLGANQTSLDSRFAPVVTANRLGSYAAIVPLPVNQHPVGIKRRHGLNLVCRIRAPTHYLARRIDPVGVLGHPFDQIHDLLTETLEWLANLLEIVGVFPIHERRPERTSRGSRVHIPHRSRMSVLAPTSFRVFLTLEKRSPSDITSHSFSSLGVDGIAKPRER